MDNLLVVRVNVVGEGHGSLSGSLCRAATEAAVVIAINDKVVMVVSIKELSFNDVLLSKINQIKVFMFSGIRVISQNRDFNFLLIRNRN